MDVVVRPHLLSERELLRLDMPPGTTIAEMVATYPWPGGTADQVCALINGIAVPPEHWRHVRPKPGTEVMLALHLQGGKKGKTILALVATIAISIYAPGWGTAIAGQMGLGATAGTIIGAGIAVVGALAISAIFKPPPIKPVASAKNEASNTYGFSGQSNAIRPYGSVPRIYGTHRVYPDACAAPYTVQVGADTYLVALYNFGYSPLHLSDFRIGDNSVSNFITPPEIYIHDNFVAGQPLNVYITDAWQDSLQIKLPGRVSVVVTTQERTDSAVLDVAWSKGLGYLNNNGGVDGRIATTHVWFKTASEDEGSWRPFMWAPWKGASDGSFNHQTQGYLKPTTSDPNTGRMILQAGQTTFNAEWGSFQPFAGCVMVIQDVWMTVQAASPGTVAFTNPLPKNIVVGIYNKAYKVPMTYWDPSGTTWLLWKASGTPFVASMHISFPWRDRWQLRVMKEEMDSTDGRYMDDRVITALKSFTNVPPVAPDVGMTIVEIRVKATDQLSGQLDNFNALATSYLVAWDGSQWVSALSSNPAWIYLDLLRGTANKKPVPDSRIDWDTIMRWAVRNDRIDPGFSQPNSRCDFVVDRTYTLWELLCSVAANGRAMPTMKDNRYSVIIDEENVTPVQVFTPRNSWGLSSQRKYLDTPHALRVKWIDPGADYKAADAMVYAPNYYQGNASVFEDFDSFGVTRWEQAIRDGRYTLGQGIYRQEEFSIMTDIENVVCTRGNLVLVAHDVLQVGGWSARISAIAGNQITLDAPMKTFELPLGVRFRSDQAVISTPIAATMIDQQTLDVVGVPVTAKVGDLVLYGTLERITGEYLVKAIEPGEDFTATITLSERASSIWQFERGAIPPYIPQPGSLVSFTTGPVRNLTGQVDAYFDDRFPMAAVKLQWAAPSVVPLPSLYIVSEVNPNDGTVREIGRTTGTSFVPLTDADIWRAPYRGANLTYEVVPMWPGLPGPATRIVVTMPTSDIEPPPALTTITAEVLSRSVRIKWDRSVDPYIAFYVVRYGAEASSWDDVAFTERKLKADTTDLPAIFLVGTHRVFVCQEDLYGIRSADISTTFLIEAPRKVPLVGNSVANTAFLRWGTLSGVVDGEWTAQTSFQIEYYEVTKLKVVSLYLRSAPPQPFHIPNSLGIIWPSTFEQIERRNARAATPTNVGKYAGEFAVSDEQQPGDWMYCVNGVDFAGNKGEPACITLAIEAPDNYFLLDEIGNLLPEPETTEAGVVQAATTPYEWLGPVNTAETWAQHFTSHSWDQIQDQLDAGFPVYAQPADTTPALIAWEFDYINPLPSLMVSAQSTYEVVAPMPTLTMRLKSKVNVGDAWTLVQQQADMVLSLLPVNSRWVRIEAEMATDAAKHGLLLLTNISYRIDVKYKDDSGIVTTAVNGTAVVVFNIPFVDVRGVSITSLDPNVAYGRATIAFDQKSMTVYTFGPTGLPVSGKISWIARGV